MSDIAVVKLDSLDDMNSIQFQVALSFSDQTLSLMLSVPRQRIWNCTVIAYCISFELSECCMTLNKFHAHDVLVSSGMTKGSLRIYSKKGWCHYRAHIVQI